MSNSDNVIIGKNTYKALKYLNRRDHVELQVIQKKFGSEVRRALLSLCENHYLSYSEDKLIYTFDTSKTIPTGVLSITVKGTDYIHKKRSMFLQWFIPTIISVLVLIVSCIDLYISISSR